MAETVTHASTEASGGYAHHAEPTFLGLDAEGWVYTGIAIFLLLAIFVGKAPKRIAEALDAKIADVRRQLDEAKSIRAEAESLLADAKARQTAAANDAAAILTQAKTEAAQLVASAQSDADAAIARRTRMAEDKIAAAERAAEADLRARAAVLAAEAARRIIATNADPAMQAKLTEQAIAELGGRLN